MQIVYTGVIAIIGISILMAVGIQIMSEFEETIDCSTLEGGANTKAASTGWGLSCYELQEKSQAGYDMTLIAIFIIAAVIVIAIVGLLGRGF